MMLRPFSGTLDEAAGLVPVAMMMEGASISDLPARAGHPQVGGVEKLAVP